MKICSSCKKELPISEFHQHGGKRRGRIEHASRCRVCTSIDRAGKAKYVPRGKQKPTTGKVYKARRRIAQYVETGKIIKPLSCPVCKQPRPKHLIHTHHYDGYDSKLKVTWMCNSCHAAEHAGYLDRVLQEKRNG